MKCELCSSNNVDRVIKRQVNGVEEELFVCNSCAIKANSGYSASDIAGALGQGGEDKGFPQVNVFMDATINIAAGPGGVAGKRCPVCGFVVTKNSSYKNLGCPECYKTFEKEIFDRKLADGYSGKRPPESDAGVEVVALKSQIEDAVRESRYADVFRLKLQLEDAESRKKGLGRPKGE